MLDQKIEAVFENGVFRPLQPVRLPEHQRVILLLPIEEETLQDDVGYEPLAFQDCTTMHVRFRRVGDFGPLPYPVDTDDPEQE